MRTTVEDQATAFIRFDNGAALVVDVSYSQHLAVAEEVTMDLFGTRGGVSVMPNVQFSTEQLTSVTPYVPQEPFQARFDRELRHFVNSIRGDETCISPVEDGVAVMEIADAVYESARTGAEIRLRPAAAR